MANLVSIATLVNLLDVGRKKSRRGNRKRREGSAEGVQQGTRGGRGGGEDRAGAAGRFQVVREARVREQGR